MTTFDSRENLINAKKKLVQALGEKEKSYWQNMKQWFKHQISKEEFDMESRRLLSKEDSHLHNKFLLAVLTKCHVAGSSSVSRDNQSLHAANKAKKSRRLQAVKRKFEHRFSPMNPTCQLPSVQLINPSKQGTTSISQDPIKTCLKSLEVPIASDMIGFVSVISWEMGLDDANDDVMDITTEAVRIFLKNLLSFIFSRRSAYKTYLGKIKHSLGTEPPNPYLFPSKNNPRHHSSRLTHEEIESEAIEVCGKMSQAEQEKTPVNAFDLLHALKTFRQSAIPSHTVYSMAVERTIMNLWHPDHDELEQDKLFAKLMAS